MKIKAFDRFPDIELDEDEEHLRDRVAIAAMHAILLGVVEADGIVTHDQIADGAYLMADCMMKAREKVHSYWK